MANKDIKDYCKNCDVEPPAMRFKCPECEHNPDNENNFAKDINVPRKEQIIINLREKLIEYNTRVKKLEEKLKWYDHYKNSALELKEKYNCLVDVNKTLEEKLNIAEEALNDIKNSFFKDEDKEIITHTESIYYYSKAQETLQKIKEEK